MEELCKSGHVLVDAGLTVATGRIHIDAYMQYTPWRTSHHGQPHLGVGTAMDIVIRRDDLAGPEIAELLQAHLKFAAEHSPAESIHALDLDRLRVSGITFWSAWSGKTLLGCGALRELSPDHGEIKSMHTALAHRGKGVAARLLMHILDEARARSYRRVSLETGSMAAFAPARTLYARFGFKPCGPFAEYREDSNSMYMTLGLTP